MRELRNLDDAWSAFRARLWRPGGSVDDIDASVARFVRSNPGVFEAHLLKSYAELADFPCRDGSGLRVLLRQPAPGTGSDWRRFDETLNSFAPLAGLTLFCAVAEAYEPMGFELAAFWVRRVGLDHIESLNLAPAVRDTLRWFCDRQYALPDVLPHDTTGMTASKR